MIEISKTGKLSNDITHIKNTMDYYLKNGDVDNVKKLLESEEYKFNETCILRSIKYKQSKCILYLLKYEIKPKDDLQYKYYMDAFDISFLEEVIVRVNKIDPPLKDEFEILKLCCENKSNIESEVLVSLIKYNKLYFLKYLHENTTKLNDTIRFMLMYLDFALSDLELKKNINRETFDWVIKIGGYNISEIDNIPDNEMTQEDRVKYIDYIVNKNINHYIYKYVLKENIELKKKNSKLQTMLLSSKLNKNIIQNIYNYIK